VKVVLLSHVLSDYAHVASVEYCNTLQLCNTARHYCITLLHEWNEVGVVVVSHVSSDCAHIVSIDYCNTLQLCNTATHYCNTQIRPMLSLLPVAAHGNTVALQRCNIHCNTVRSCRSCLYYISRVRQSVVVCCSVLQCDAVCCNVMQCVVSISFYL